MAGRLHATLSQLGFPLPKSQNDSLCLVAQRDDDALNLALFLHPASCCGCGRLPAIGGARLWEALWAAFCSSGYGHRRSGQTYPANVKTGLAVWCALFFNRCLETAVSGRQGHASCEIVPLR